MSLESSIIELFDDVNERFYTAFIVPLKQKTLRNVIAIFLFNNSSFTRNELEGILKGVVQQLTFDQLQVFNSSLESLKKPEGGVLFVNNYSYTMPINAYVLYNRPYPPFKITQSTNNFQYKGALQYLNIEQIVLEHLKDDWSLSNSSDSDDQLKSLGKKVDIIDSSEDEELEMIPENIIKEAKKLLEEVDKLIEQFKYEAISRNTFGKNRRRSYRKRTVTSRRSNKRKSKGRSDRKSASTRGRSDLKSAPTRGRSKKKYCHR